MARRQTIEFVEASKPIQEPVTKFGGQPFWMLSPQWPLSRETGKPMLFIGQMVIDPAMFANAEGRMAYLFMTDGDEYVDETWEPDGGENAVIVQPGDALVPVQPITNGPSLYRMVPRAGHDRLVPEPCEFAVRLTAAEDPEFVPDQEQWILELESREKYYQALWGSKIGGTPGFIQGDEFPSDEFQRLLLQLNSTGVPFSINFGDNGVGFAFLSNDGRSGKFLWQCF